MVDQGCNTALALAAQLPALTSVKAEVVLPEGTPAPEKDRPHTPTVVAVGIAMLALLAVTFVLGQATSPPERVIAGSTSTTQTAPVVPPTPTTMIDPETFSVGDIATEKNLLWFRAPPLLGRWPIDMLDHEDSVYLFTTSMPPRGSTHGGGMEVLVSNDGIGWKSLGEVIEREYVINGVDSTEQGLIATGNHIETGTPHIWTAVNGMDWRISDLPDETAEEVLPNFARPTAATRFKGRLVVLGNAQSDLLSLVEERLPDSVTRAEIARYGFEISERDRILHIRGPLGLIGYSESLGQLGIDDAMATRLLYMAQTEESLAWSSPDAVNWDSNSFNAFSIEHIWHGSSQRLYASGFGVFGPMVWTSIDGRRWDRVGSSSVGRAQVMWQERIIATTHNHHLLQSSDGSNWEYLDTGDILPPELSWDMGPVGAGEAGLAVVATMRREPGPAPPAVVMERDDHVLRIDPLTSTLTITSGGSSILTVPLWSGEPSAAVQIDFANRQVIFANEDSGEEILTVDFSTLDQAERLMRNTGSNVERALMFTEGGTTWTVHALSDDIGPDVVDRMVVMRDRIILLTHPTSASVDDIDPPQMTVRVGVFQSAATG